MDTLAVFSRSPNGHLDGINVEPLDTLEGLWRLSVWIACNGVYGTLAL